jgi:hypothetical protein
MLFTIGRIMNKPWKTFTRLMNLTMHSFKYDPWKCGNNVQGLSRYFGRP